MNGHSCEQHTCCGSQVKVGDILCVKRTVIQTDEGVEPALSCILIQDSSETFQVGFIGLTCRILGLTAFNSLLQCVNRVVWEVCSVN